jgi:hypothetical protein
MRKLRLIEVRELSQAIQQVTVELQLESRVVYF